MKFVFIASRARVLRVFVLAVALAAIVAAAVVLDAGDGRVMARTADFHIVIDAGHGGKDKGASGPSGVYESRINLAIARYLEAECKARGIGTTLTRVNDDWLASPFASNKKRDDMNERRKIIEKVRPDLVVSIHLNTFPADRSVRGLQCFYARGSESSRQFAEAVQAQYNGGEQNRDRVAKTGEYYILECTAFPSVLVECGFLSNREEEGLLATAQYQKIIAHYIASGIDAVRINNQAGTDIQ